MAFGFLRLTSRGRVGSLQNVAECLPIELLRSETTQPTVVPRRPECHFIEISDARLGHRM